MLARLAVFGASTFAQDYPVKAIHMIAPFALGAQGTSRNAALCCAWEN